uniref:DUF1995 domain-containing protein n=1 Tax=Fagus sylvatica TaxID=28930 RepID=A0A2N9EE32_FAGSY
MASSYSSCCFFNCCSFASSLPNPSSSTTHFSLSFTHSILNGHNGISLHKAGSSSRICAKFDKFQGEPPLDSVEAVTPSTLSAQPQTIQEEVEVEEEEEDDSCLPPDLEGAVRQSSQASSLFLSSGGMRAIVELLIPQLQFLDDEGAQAELWDLSRIFLDTLIEETGCQKVKAIFPDAGAAALLKYRLSDRKPVESEDEIVVMVVPDYQMLAYVEKIASNLSDDPVLI